MKLLNTSSHGAKSPFLNWVALPVLRTGLKPLKKRASCIWLPKIYGAFHLNCGTYSGKIRRKPSAPHCFRSRNIVATWFPFLPKELHPLPSRGWMMKLKNGPAMSCFRSLRRLTKFWMKSRLMVTDWLMDLLLKWLRDSIYIENKNIPTPHS